MGKIIQLSDDLSNRIAAGEVVERPASVVKELVENSIDANSTLIEIEVEEAGLQTIRIIDNGDGIDRDDVLKAFSRHATSKIKNENDLFRIRTLGFRGEALPSIASVSILELKTSTGEEAGTHIVLEGGKMISEGSCSARKGTEITVSDLFFNTPARLKYVKTINTELGNITDVVNRLAMSHPEISFRLMHNGKKILHTNGNGDVRAVLAAIYGFNLAKKMLPVAAESLDFRVTGYVSYPESTRASRNYISILINGRYIKNFLLTKAIMEGYHTLLPIGRYPIVMLDIQMDPILVDVNVHPAKMEVRLSKEHELMELITTMIVQTFKKEVLIPSTLDKKKKSNQPKPEQVAFALESRAEKQPPSSLVRTAPYRDESQAISVLNRTIKEDGLIQKRQADYSPPEAVEGPAFSEPEHLAETEDAEPFLEEAGTNAENQPAIEDVANLEPQLDRGRDIGQSERIPALYPIGQLHGTYILAQNEKGLYMIDQHAAQERIKYEYFREKVGEVGKNLQEMLVPLTLQYSNDEFIKLSENKELLEEVGIFLEEFGHNSFIVRAHPQWYPAGAEQEITEGLINQLLDMRKVDVKKLREEAAIMMSCKASIKANHHLRHDEMVSLLDQLRNSSDPFTCPHGRPIIVHYSTYEIEKMFKRIM